MLEFFIGILKIIYLYIHMCKCINKDGASQVALVVKNLFANAGNIRNAGLIPGSGRSPAGGYATPLQNSRLGNPMDRGTWQAMVRRITKS